MTHSLKPQTGKPEPNFISANYYIVSLRLSLLDMNQFHIIFIFTGCTLPFSIDIGLGGLAIALSGFLVKIVLGRKVFIS